MSFSENSTLPTGMQRKRTASERVTDYGDPLVVRKKTRQAAKKITQVNIYIYYNKTHFS